MSLMLDILWLHSRPMSASCSSWGSLTLSLLLSSEVLMSVEPFHQSSSGVEQRPAIHHDCGHSWTGPKRCNGKFNIMEPLTDHCHRILGHVQCKSRIPKKTTAKAVVQNF